MQAGALNNPYLNFIGADIRSDPWGYAAPGWPEKAAELAWRDATISHRRNGIYSAMYWSAVIAAAFAVDEHDGRAENRAGRDSGRIHYRA